MISVYWMLRYAMSLALAIAIYLLCSNYKLIYCIMYIMSMRTVFRCINIYRTECKYLQTIGNCLGFYVFCDCSTKREIAKPSNFWLRWQIQVTENPFFIRRNLFYFNFPSVCACPFRSRFRARAVNVMHTMVPLFDMSWIRFEKKKNILINVSVFFFFRVLDAGANPSQR